MKWWGLCVLVVALSLACAAKGPSEQGVVTQEITVVLSPGFNHTLAPIGVVTDASGVEIPNPEIGDIVLHNLRTIRMIFNIIICISIVPSIILIVVLVK